MVHTTGSGPWMRWHRGGYDAPFDAALHVYKHISKYSPHYLVCGDSGRVVQLNAIALKANHVGSKGAWKYRLKGWSSNNGLGWWHTRFPKARSPRDLLGGALWKRGGANGLTIGIEISPPKSGPRDAWSDTCWEALSELVENLCLTHRIPRDRYHVITHSDAHPLRRMTKRGSPWDPGPKQWQIGKATNLLGLA